MGGGKKKQAFKKEKRFKNKISQQLIHIITRNKRFSFGDGCIIHNLQKLEKYLI